MLTELWEQAQDLLGLREQQFQQDLQLSSDAKRILAEPLIQRFFEETEKHLVDQWKNTRPNEKMEREVAYQLLTMTKSFRNYFETFLANEQYALQQLGEIGKEQ